MRTSPPYSLTSGGQRRTLLCSVVAWAQPPVPFDMRIEHRVSSSAARLPWSGVSAGISRSAAASRSRGEEGGRPVEPGRRCSRSWRDGGQSSFLFCPSVLFPQVTRASVPLLGSRIGLSAGLTACQRIDALGGGSMAGRGCRAGRPQPRDRLTESRVRTRSGLHDATYPVAQRGRPARATARGRPKTVRQRSWRTAPRQSLRGHPAE